MHSPLWKHVVDLGLDVIVVHKILLIRKVSMESYDMGDVNEAAASFPDLDVEVVHCGLTSARGIG